MVNFSLTLKGWLSTLALACAMLATPALAEPGGSDTASGAATAQVVEPIDLQWIADLRFGRIMQPVVGGRLELSPTGAIATTGDIGISIDTPQATNGRGPAAFAAFDDGNRKFLVTVPNRIDISNGTATMRVDKFTSQLSNGANYMNMTGYTGILVGARLTVGAMQPVGTYTGDFTITVSYF